MAIAIILMGVSGCGKSSVGRELSACLGWPFFDGDDYHPLENINKMAREIPLDDKDRLPWLKSLHGLIVNSLDRGQSLILACSALKRAYREILKGDRQDVRFVYLEGTYELIHQRMLERSEHYMKARMLQSQFGELEPPVRALRVNIDRPVREIVEKIRNLLDPQAMVGD
ncbi:MAG: gluconokinase [Anaerolineales bacterium]